jgi:RHS repeat-associated protein
MGGANVYGYDGDGKRVKKTENGATTYYVYSSKLGQSVMEVTANSVQRAYVDMGGQIVAMQATDGQFYWLHVNHLGSSRAMTDSSGNLAYKGQFDPYGASLTEWSNSGNTNLNTKKFTGYERDGSGLDYAQARMYNSARGRFLTPDPIGLKAANVKRPQSLNLYTYVHNDPVNLVDPTGEFAYLPPNHNYGIDGCLRAGGIWAVTGYDAIGRPVWGCIGGGGSSSNSGGQGINRGNGVQGESPPTIDREEGIKNYFRDFLENDLSPECKTALSQDLTKITFLYRTANLIDVEKHESSLAKAFWGASEVNSPTETLGQAFNRVRQTSTVPGAYTIWGTAPVNGIYFRGSQVGFSSGGSMYLLLHEMAHLALEKTDQELVTQFGITPKAGEDASKALSRFFNNKCKDE